MCWMVVLLKPNEGVHQQIRLKLWTKRSCTAVHGSARGPVVLLVASNWGTLLSNLQMRRGQGCCTMNSILHCCAEMFLSFDIFGGSSREFKCGCKTEYLDFSALNTDSLFAALKLFWAFSGSVSAFTINKVWKNVWMLLNLCLFLISKSLTLSIAKNLNNEKELFLWKLFSRLSKV